MYVLLQCGNEPRVSDALFFSKFLAELTRPALLVSNLYLLLSVEKTQRECVGWRTTCGFWGPTLVSGLSSRHLDLLSHLLSPLFYFRDEGLLSALAGLELTL